MISVVMPCYNAARYLRDTIQSVLNQTFQDFALVICDDGSTDDSADIVRAVGDPRISLWQHTENRGIAKAFNSALRATDPHRPYIAILAADDLLTRDSLAVRLKTIQQGYDLVCGQAASIGPDTTLAEAYARLSNPVLVHLHAPRPLRTFYGPTNLLRRSLFQRYGLLDDTLPAKMDREFWVRLFGLDQQRTDRATFHRLRSIVGYSRRHADSFSARTGRLPDADHQRIIDLYLQAVARRAERIEDVEFLP